jgi:uncharacterized damage-inducible protein DinB
MNTKTFVLPALFMVCSMSALEHRQQPDPKPLANAANLAFDAKKEGRALRVFLASIRSQITSAASAMPADKYGFAPTAGEFTGVRSFRQQLKHLSAANHILAAAALGEDPPADAGDERGPDTVRTKAEVLDYLNLSFEHLDKAIDRIGETNLAAKPSPISPLRGSEVTWIALIEEALIHAFDHYGQMVVYMPMNGVVPPASQR